MSFINFPKSWSGPPIATAITAGTAPTSSATNEENKQQRDGRYNPNGPDLHLPPDAPPLTEGFARSYGCVATNPDDVRVSDLLHLLKDYRMLVYATKIMMTWWANKRCGGKVRIGMETAYSVNKG